LSVGALYQGTGRRMSWIKILSEILSHYAAIGQRRMFRFALCHSGKAAFLGALTARQLPLSCFVGPAR
jgi:hypothetical protein